jgi:hypothetical protein
MSKTTASLSARLVRGLGELGLPPEAVVSFFLIFYGRPMALNASFAP